MVHSLSTPTTVLPHFLFNLSIYQLIYLQIYQSIYVCIYLLMSTYLCLPTFVYLPMSTFLYLPTYIYLPISTYLYLPTYIYLPISTYLNVPNLINFFEPKSQNFCLISQVPWHLIGIAFTNGKWEKFKRRGLCFQVELFCSTPRTCSTYLFSNLCLYVSTLVGR